MKETVKPEIDPKTLVTFLRTRTSPSKDGFATAKQLREAYRKWAREQGLVYEAEITDIGFGMRLGPALAKLRVRGKRHSVRKRQGDGGLRIYRGLKLKD